MVGLISAPLMEWSTRLPELGAQLKDKMHVFDRPLALWHELQGMVGIPDAASGTGFQLPKFDWLEARGRIPVADLHRVPAVHRDIDPVHRELA